MILRSRQRPGTKKDNRGAIVARGTAPKRPAERRQEEGGGFDWATRPSHPAFDAEGDTRPCGKWFSTIAKKKRLAFTASDATLALNSLV